MPLVISRNLILSSVQTLPAYSPVVGWHNLVTAENVTAETEDASYPAVNLATNRTPERWQADDTSEQRIIVDLSNYVGEVDYIAVARHNFGSAQIAVTVQGYTEMGESPVEPVWFDLCQEVMLANDQAVIFRFDPQGLVGISLLLKTGSEVARAAVLYVGKLLILPPHIQPDFTPLPQGRVVDYTVDVTESGEYLGNLVLGRTLESSVTLPYLDPDWYDDEMDPFIEASATTPFFFSWDPLNHPMQTGFAWIKPGSNPQPRIHDVVGYKSITLDMAGIV
jgi:hypothetical protein